MKRNLLSLAFIAILTYSMFAPGLVVAQDTNPDAAFNITLLSPNSNPARNAWSALMAEELPKIGVGVTEHISAGWDVVGPRTFAHPAESGIPDYDNGGYDAFFVGLSGSLDYDPSGSYDSSNLSPAGLNFAWYENDTMDAAIADYTSTLTASGRAPHAQTIQEIAFEDVPYIPLVNTAGLWAYDATMTLSDAQLLMFGTTNLADGWKDIDHPTKADIVYGHPYELTEFHPFAVQSYIAAQYLNTVFPGLYERDLADSNYAMSPLIADALPTWNDANDVAEVKVKADAKFSNGNPVTAADVVNTYRMQMQPAAASANYAYITTYIANNESVYVKEGTTDTVVFELKAPYFLSTSLFSLGVVDSSVIGTPDAPLGASANSTASEWDFNQVIDGKNPFAIGAGAFAIDSIDATANNFRVTAVDNYWNGDVALDSISFNFYSTKEGVITALQGGSVDIIDAQFVLDVADVEDVEEAKYAISGDFGIQMLSVNMLHPILGTGEDTPLGQADSSKAADAARYVRKAMAHAVPRQLIVDEILKGVGSPLQTLWPGPAAGFYDQGGYDYDLDLAMEYLKMAGYMGGLDSSETTDDEGPIANLLLLSAFALGIPVILRKRK